MEYAFGMVDIGRRIVVYGPTGSGKTTVAARIAVCLGVHHIELDAIAWLPGWVMKPLDEYRADISKVLNEHNKGWVCDGNYSEVRTLTLPQADTVVWLRLSYRVAFWRVLKRTVTRAWRREMLWGTNYESWRLSFLSRDSLLLYQATAWRRHHRGVSADLEGLPHHARVYELRSPREVEVFLAEVCAADR
ncbi:MAG: toxin [Dehalococcoidia bacterium]|nr:toxin [Dehalococcoidia bacterium]MBL7166246.1 toxin [Dehalococcoidales bacterium]